MKRMISAATSTTMRHLKKDTLIYVALGIIIGLLISMNSPSTVTADSDSVARELRKLNSRLSTLNSTLSTLNTNSRLSTLNSRLDTLNSRLGAPNPGSALYRIADELDDLESEMRRHR